MQRRVVSFATVLLILYAAVLPLATGSHSELRHSDARPDGAALANGASAIAADRVARTEVLPVEPDNVVLQIDVYRNGTADWRVEHWIRLNDSATAATFRSVRRSVREGSANGTGEFHRRTRRSVAAAENATGREMSVTGFDASATVRQIPQRYGVVVYGFRWDGFANVTDDRIRVGGALEGLFLGSGEHLSMSWPDEYELAEVDPAPDETMADAIVWRGPTVFGLDGPRLLLVDRPGPLPRLLALGTAVAAVILLAVLVKVRRDGLIVPAPLAALAFGRGSEESELLSDEERVIRMLEERGGRVKQREVADELGWSTSKTSYVVSNLREDERIDTFRIGHENVLSLSESSEVHGSET